MEKIHVHEQTYHEYLSRIAELDLPYLAEKLGIQLDGQHVTVPFLGKLYRVSSLGISDPLNRQPHLSVCVILCKYLLMCPMIEPLAGNWMSYKDFKDAAPLIRAFENTVTQPIAATFSGRQAALETAGKKCGGYLPADKYPYDFAMQFDALPTLSVLLLFNDKDDEFPAQCSVLFEKRAENYLDMECLAMLGMLFCEYLKSGAGF
ncbi:MAG: DUF3786 domain-containing protein [Desulfobacterales bacterium]|jgi:hypothetical protein